MTLAVLLGFVPNEGDAWGYTMDALGRYFTQVLTHRPEQGPLLPNRPFLDLVAEDLPAIVPETIGHYLESALLMGKRTADLHVALASIADNPDFAPEPFTAFYQRSLYQTIRTRVFQVLDLLRNRARDLPRRRAKTPRNCGAGRTTF